MKRFVDLRGQDTQYNFAWWDTIVNRFETYSGVMAWDTWDEFAQDHAREQTDTSAELERYEKICPKWAGGLADTEKQ